MRRLLLFASIFLAGVSGLGLEVLLLSSAGLALGYGRSTAVGIAVFIAGWGLGAYLSGRFGRRTAPALIALGVALGIVSEPALALLLRVGGAAPSGITAEVTAVALIAGIAVLQGAFLPLLARAAEHLTPSKRDVSALLACSFGGSVLGAYGIGQHAVAELGRTGAAFVAGVVACAAGCLAAAALRGVAEPQTAASVVSVEPRPAKELSLARAGWIVGLTTAWLAGLEWIGLRLGVLWLSGMQPALTAVLCASLIALALGAFVLPRAVRVSPLGTVAILCACAVGAAWPVIAASAMQLAGRAVQAFHPSSSVEARAPLEALQELPELARALVLVGPSLFALGAIVPVLHRLLPETCGASGERLGRLYLHEAWGALVGVPLVHFALVPTMGLAGATAALMLIGALSFIATYALAPRSSAIAFAAVVVLALWTRAQRDPALDSPPLSNPAFTLRSFRHDRDFAVAVVDDGRAGERTLLTDGFRAAGTGDEYRYMRMLGHLPVLLHERPKRVAVLALGTGTTLGAVALHPEVEAIDVLEISPAVVDAAPWFVLKNRGVLEDVGAADASESPGRARVRVCTGDGRFTLTRHPAQYDVITMEPLLPDSPFAVYLYTREFYSCAARALAPGGLVCQWVPPHALEPSTFDAVLDAFSASFGWSSVWLFGTQVILLGGEREPALASARFATQDAHLAADLRELGIGSPRGLLARFIRSTTARSLGEAADDGATNERRSPRDRRSTASSIVHAAAVDSTSAARALTDADPWIAYRPRRGGAILLGDLPANLASLRRSEGDPPEAWLAAAGVDGRRMLRGVRAVHAAREAHSREEARLRGADVAPRSGDPELAAALAQARLECAGDPELAELEREIRFLSALRRGIAALSADRSRAGAEAALPDLLAAAEISRERADVHLYMAAALSRLSSAAAIKALDTALTRCPRAAETVEGRRAHGLGLAEDLWQRAEQAADAAAKRDP